MRLFLKSLVANKCPKCMEGSVFQTKNFYNLRHFHKMNKACPSCGNTFEKEPGFFYGAMYVAYAIMVAWFVFCWAVSIIFGGLASGPFIAVVFITSVLLLPITFRLSRMIWIWMFTKR